MYCKTNLVCRNACSNIQRTHQTVLVPQAGLWLKLYFIFRQFWVLFLARKRAVKIADWSCFSSVTPRKRRTYIHTTTVAFSTSFLTSLS